MLMNRVFIVFACVMFGSFSAKAQVRECTPTDQFGRACISAGKIHKALYSKRVIEWTFKNSCSKSVNVNVRTNDGKTDGINVSAEGSAKAMCFEEHGCTAFTGYEVECNQRDKIYKNIPNRSGTSSAQEKGKDSGNSSYSNQSEEVKRARFLSCSSAMENCISICYDKYPSDPFNSCKFCDASFKPCLDGKIAAEIISNRYSNNNKTQSSNNRVNSCECNGNVGIIWCEWAKREYQCIREKNGVVYSEDCPGRRCTGKTKNSAGRY